MAGTEDSAAVEHNLDHAGQTQDLDGGITAATEAHGGPTLHEPDPSIAGIFNATVIVSLAMAVLIAMLIWKRVPAVIGRILDGRIAAIRNQLEEASRLRREAEALKAEYEAKIAAAGREAEALRAAAREEAARAIEDAKAHATDLVARRQKMAEDKIAGAERAAIAEIRALTVQAATAAAATLIAQNHDAAADRAMVDQAIRGIGTAH